jgi:uncharacterized membrane protein YhaH (DUF805 family)
MFDITCHMSQKLHDLCTAHNIALSDIIAILILTLPHIACHMSQKLHDLCTAHNIALSDITAIVSKNSLEMDAIAKVTKLACHTVDFIHCLYDSLGE